MQRGNQAPQPGERPGRGRAGMASAALASAVLAGILRLRSFGLRSLATWPWARGLVLLIFALPMMALLGVSLTASTSLFEALDASSLWHLAGNSLILTLLAVLGAALIGACAAMIVGLFQFPGRRWLGGLMLLPMAVPAYVNAFVYTDLLEYAGPLQKGLRWLFGWQSKADYWFFEVRSLPMAAIMLALVLYPYVYLITLVSIQRMGQSLIDAGRMLDHDAWRRFFRLVLPPLLPAVAAGSAIVAMESLADFGTVDFFAVPVLTTGMFDLWINRGNLPAASQMALGLLVFVAFMLLGKQALHVKGASLDASKGGAMRRKPLAGRGLLLAYVFLLLTWGLAFALPIARLVWLALNSARWGLDNSLLAAFGSTLWLGTVAALATGLVALALIVTARLQPNSKLATLDSFATLGYAIPGVVMGLGVLLVLTSIDKLLSHAFLAWFDWRPRLWLTGTAFALILAYSLRFFASAYNSLAEVSRRIGPNVEWAARSLGRSGRAIVWQIHLPLLAGGLLTGGLLVFVDTVKELPATLLLRPFNMNTLATHVYQFASDGLLEESAAGACLIVIIGLAPVLLLVRALR